MVQLIDLLLRSADERRETEALWHGAKPYATRLLSIKQDSPFLPSICIPRFEEEGEGPSSPVPLNCFSFH